jgi:uncharacterized damage-inducible protein DinB
LKITSVHSFIEYFEGIRARTRRVVQLIPPDDLEFRPIPTSFSPGDLVRHIAGTERFMFIENVFGRPSAYPGHTSELADGFEAVMAYFDRLHADSIALLRDMKDSELTGRCRTVSGTEISVWKWLRAMVEHEVHHRGQLYLLLGIRGVSTPPLYGLTEHQVLQASLRRPID